MKRHVFDPISLAAGSVFLLLAVGAGGSGRFNYRLDEWVLPASVLVLGVGFLAVAVRGLRSERLVDSDAGDTDVDEEANSLD